MPKILMPYTVHLDHTLRVTPVSTLFYKGDSNAHRFELNVLSKGLQADLSGCTAVYRFYRLQDSTVVSNPASIESGKVVAVLDKACYDYIGRFALTIAIQNGEEETTVFYGDGYMSGNRADTGITGDYVVYDVETLLAKIAEIETAIENANTAIANANTAAENANAAEENANAAASGAQSAAGSANEAARTANTAANRANTAASAANTASSAANTAAGAANSAASSAQTAAQNANAATQASQTQQQAVAKAEAARDTAEQERQDSERARQETFAGYEERIVAATPDDTTVNGRAWTSKKTVDSLCMPLEATGNTVQVYPVEGYPLGVKVSWEPVQAGSGDPSPDNVRPITGRDSVQVVRCGKNLTSAKDVTIENSTHPYFNVGTGFRCEPGITVTVSYDINTTVQPFDASLGLGERNGVYHYDLPGYKSNLSNGRIVLSCTVTQDHLDRGFEYLCIRPCRFGVNPEPYTVSVSNIQLELGSTATAYEPYTGSTTDISLPETVYGGTLDVETGVVNTTWGHIASYAGEALPGEWISDRDVYSSGAVPTTGAQVVYKLKTPDTIQLTKQKIAALSGVNTLYTDAGTLTVTGREDPRHTIVTLTDRIAALESAAAGV